jgi:hypothetical protein
MGKMKISSKIEHNVQKLEVVSNFIEDLDPVVPAVAELEQVTVYIDRPVEVIKEVEKIIYVDKPVEVVKEVLKEVEVIKEVEIKVPVYVDRPFEVVKEVEKVCYIDRIKTVKTLHHWSIMFMVLQSFAIVLLLLKGN